MPASALPDAGQQINIVKDEREQLIGKGALGTKKQEIVLEKQACFAGNMLNGLNAKYPQTGSSGSALLRMSR